MSTDPSARAQIYSQWITPISSIFSDVVQITYILISYNILRLFLIHLILDIPHPHLYHSKSFYIHDIFLNSYIQIYPIPQPSYYSPISPRIIYRIYSYWMAPLYEWHLQLNDIFFNEWKICRMAASIWMAPLIERPFLNINYITLISLSTFMDNCDIFEGIKRDLKQIKGYQGIWED